MTIAVSVLLRPSRVLLILSAGMSVLLCACGALLFSVLSDALSLHSRITLSLMCISAGLAGFFLMISRRKAFRIDISGTGQIRLNDTSRRAVANSEAGTGDEVVQLLSDSTLWPTVMILRLKAGSGRITVVPVLPDSLGRADFRAVCVACRWIAAQNTRPAARASKKNLLSD